MAVVDDQIYGDASLVPTQLEADVKYPVVENGILAERIVSRPELILCGAGHVSVQTAAIARMCNFAVTVIDERKDFANPERFPGCTVINLPFEVALERISAANAYYVIVTRGHLNDRECLEQILKKDFTYCGMIGSHKKVRLVFDHLLASGYSEELIRKVCAPIGLEIGANTPEEIAVSIVGEMIRHKYSGITGVEWDEQLINALETLPPPYAVVTIVEKHGSAPRTTGARMVVTDDGTIISSVGGGFGEYEASLKAIELLHQDGTQAVRYTCMMNNEDASAAGMICGGSIDVLIQTVRS